LDVEGGGGGRTAAIGWYYHVYLVFMSLRNLKNVTFCACFVHPAPSLCHPSRAARPARPSSLPSTLCLHCPLPSPPTSPHTVLYPFFTTEPWFVCGAQRASVATPTAASSALTSFNTSVSSL
jgi:hypothetical protein